MVNVKGMTTDNPIVTTGMITVCAMAVAQIILCVASGKAWGTAYLWSVGSFAVGGMLGFLFGVPKILQNETTKTERYRQIVNTNFEQISDWLTKIVVGLTLVNATRISDSFKGTAGVFARALGNREGDVAVAMAVIVYFSIIGFLSVYILTRLYLSRAFFMFEQTQESLEKAQNATTLDEAKSHVGSALVTLRSQSGSVDPVASEPKGS
jgi:hypothetical protein